MVKFPSFLPVPCPRDRASSCILLAADKIVIPIYEEDSMTMEGIPAGGFKTLGEIDGTNALRFGAKQTGLAIALELLSSHTSGAPIVNDDGKFIGFVSEFDLLGAI